jgi:hypothetical protein
VGGGIANPLTNPQLDLNDATDVIARNDDWQTTQIGGVITADQVAEIQGSMLAPGNAAEPAMIVTLSPGSYTAIVSGVNAGTGVATVEVYDVSPAVVARLANISTRGFVQTVDNVMIGGIIVVNQPSRLLIRARGPSLAPAGIANPLLNPQLELNNATDTIAMNDNWQTTQIGGVITADQVAEIQGSMLAPPDAAEAAIIVTLPPGAYTAIVRGVSESIGVGTVEVYTIQ